MRPNVKRLERVGAALLVLSGIAPQYAWAQTAASGELKALIGIRTTPTRQNGVPGGTYVGDDMLIGESTRLNVAVGQGDDLCFNSVWASESGTLPAAAQARVDEREAAAHYVWRFDVRTLEVMTDRIKFDLTWQRTSRAMPGEVLRRTQQLTLREGESRPIDLLHGRQGTDCVSVVLEVTAGIAEDPKGIVKTIEWDLWLSGGQQTEPHHRALTSPPGESAAFQFEPMATTATSLSGKVDAVSVNVYGQLRGRVRPDGSIDVALTTNRWVSYGSSRPPTIVPRQPGPAGGSGQKNFTIKPGEAVKIVLPPFTNVQIRTDPVTGARSTGTVAVAPPTSAPPTGEMSITVQARVRE